MIRNDIERRRSEEELEYLRSELDSIDGDQQDDILRSVENGLRIQISDIEDRIAEYDRLKAGRDGVLKGESLDDLGELIIKARITRGWSQADLARALGMEPQQVQRYERNDWQKISLWRLQEVAEVLGLNMIIHGWLGGRETAYPLSPTWHLHHGWDAQGLGSLEPRILSFGEEEAATHHAVLNTVVGTESGRLVSAPRRRVYRTEESEGIKYAPPESSHGAAGATLVLQDLHG